MVLSTEVNVVGWCGSGGESRSVLELNDTVAEIGNVFRFHGGNTVVTLSLRTSFIVDPLGLTRFADVILSLDVTIGVGESRDVTVRTFGIRAPREEIDTIEMIILTGFATLCLPSSAGNSHEVLDVIGGLGSVHGAIDLATEFLDLVNLTIADRVGVGVECFGALSLETGCAVHGTPVSHLSELHGFLNGSVAFLGILIKNKIEVSIVVVTIAALNVDGTRVISSPVDFRTIVIHLNVSFGSTLLAHFHVLLLLSGSHGTSSTTRLDPRWLVVGLVRHQYPVSLYPFRIF